MIFFILTVVLTLGVSAVCSMLEAMVLSTTPLEIETLKRKSPRRGELLETFVAKIDETSSAILTANTIANTFGATLAGIQFASLVSAFDHWIAFVLLLCIGASMIKESRGCDEEETASISFMTRITSGSLTAGSSVPSIAAATLR